VVGRLQCDEHHAFCLLCFFSLYLSDFNEQLISLVQPWPVIFYCRLPNYKNQKVKEDVWREVNNYMIVGGECHQQKSIC